jgi:hypothetical protein
MEFRDRVVRSEANRATEQCRSVIQHSRPLLGERAPASRTENKDREKDNKTPANMPAQVL